MTEKSAPQEGTISLNDLALNNIISKYFKQKLINCKKVDKSTITVKCVKDPFSITGSHWGNR